MKSFRDAATLLLLVVLVASFRVAPVDDVIEADEVDQAVQLVPTASAASHEVAEENSLVPARLLDSSEAMLLAPSMNGLRVERASFDSSDRFEEFKGLESEDGTRRVLVIFEMDSPATPDATHPTCPPELPRRRAQERTEVHRVSTSC